MADPITPQSGAAPEGGAPQNDPKAAPLADPAKASQDPGQKDVGGDPGNEPPKELGSEPEKKEGDPEKPVVPEKYDFKLPEGSLLQPKDLEDISAFAKENGLSMGAAQIVLEREHAAIQRYAAAQVAELEEKKTSWIETVKMDKELGGDEAKAKVSADAAHRVFKRFGSEAFNEVLEKTGLGSHPELVRFAVRVEKAMADDKIVDPTKTGVSGGGDRLSDAEVFYGQKKGA